MGENNLWIHNVDLMDPDPQLYFAVKLGKKLIDFLLKVPTLLCELLCIRIRNYCVYVALFSN